VPPPPSDVHDLQSWAIAHDVAERLDDFIIGGIYDFGHARLLGAQRERLTFRQILITREGHPGGSRYYFNADDRARESLHRVAISIVRQRQARAWLAANGREPEDDVLAPFLSKLRAEKAALQQGTAFNPLPFGTYEPRAVRLDKTPLPALRYEESFLTVAQGARIDDADSDGEIALSLLGWDEGELQFGRLHDGRLLPGGVTPEAQYRALESWIDFMRDPRRALTHEALSELLHLRAWQYALGTLDENLSLLHAQVEAGSPSGHDRGASAAAAPPTRLAFRVIPHARGTLDVEAVVQKRLKSGAFSAGSRVDWHLLPDRRELTPADRLVFQAYDDRFARDSHAWGGRWSGAQIFGVLRALIDHPAVLLAGQRDTTIRPDIRLGRLQLRFVAAADVALAPRFDLLDVTLLPAVAAEALRGNQHLIYLHRPETGAPRILLAQVSPQAAAVVRALAAAPAQFPPESHDALAARLESLQESMDIEFPSQWTRTIAAADGRLVVRLEMLASGAVQIRMVVRPVKLGPVFLPGEGPALVLEGQGRERHGAQRDRQAERQSGRALATRLGLDGGAESEPWCWRVGAGDAAFQLVAELKAVGEAVAVEWADDAQLFSLGSVGRGQMRMQVADRRDWFSVEGGAEIAGEIVPLATLFAAIRDGRRYVPVRGGGFVRIEDTLREALAQAEAAVFESRGNLQVSAVGSDPLMGLVEREAQVKASGAFLALRRRMRQGARETPTLPENLEATLRPYQKEGVAWLARLAHWGAGALLADEMGLGKTVQTLAVLAHRSPIGPALVVAPTSVVANWVDESARFTPQLRVKLYRSSERAALLESLGPGDLVVTSYAIATLDAETLARIRFATLVLDEAQAVKNATTERAKALRDLDAAWRLGLTGTPIENHLGELWSILRVISPGLLGSWEQFRARYSIPIEKFGDDTRRRSLAMLLRPFVLRRLKSEVARELPARTEIVRVVRLSAEEQTLYEELRRSTIDELAQAKKDPERDAGDVRFVLLAALTRLRQLCCHPRLVYPNTTAGSAKAAHLLELLGELRDEGHKSLVFSQFRSFLDLLAPRLRQHGFRVLVLDGTTPVEVREKRIAAFQAGEADVFLISLKAGGFGLNLTAADTVIHLDPWWNPAVEDQATARAHRMGQTRPVTAVRLVARGTIEEAVLGLHASKRALAAGILEGTEVAASLGTEELVKLIERGFDSGGS
jgi:superfamily II DNA or RNA helicase